MPHLGMNILYMYIFLIIYYIEFLEMNCNKTWAFGNYKHETKAITSGAIQVCKRTENKI